MNMEKGVGVYKTEGIIIKAADLGELDRLLTIYTKTHGKIQARAISARKKTAKLNGLLQSFTAGQFLLAKSKTLDIITDVAITDSYVYLHNNLSALAYAYYFSELVDKLVVAPERDDNLWRLINRAFEVLNSPQPSLKIREGVRPPLKLRGGEGELYSDLPKIRLAFEDKLVEFLGHPKPEGRGKAISLQRLNYLQSLAGEQINSYKFLAQVHK